MITQAIMRTMSEPHALHACTVTRAKALAVSTRGIRDYLYPPFAQLVISSSGSVYNTTCFIALVFHGHNNSIAKCTLDNVSRGLHSPRFSNVSPRH